MQKKPWTYSDTLGIAVVILIYNGGWLTAQPGWGSWVVGIVSALIGLVLVHKAPR